MRLVQRRSMVCASALCAAIAIALTGCGSVVSSSGHKGKTPVSMMLDWTWESYHSPFMYALEKGWYSAAGVDLSLNQGDGSTNTATLVGRGSSNMGFADTSTMDLVASEGVPVENVLVIDKQAAFATECFKSVNLTNPRSLVGKTIEVTSGSSQAAIFPGYLAINHISPSSITEVTAEPTDEVTVFVEHKAQCMIGEVGEDLLNASLENSQIGAPLPWAKSGVELMGYGLITSKSFAASHPAAVKAVVSVTARAFKYVCAHQTSGLSLFNRLHPQLAATASERKYSAGQLGAVCQELAAPPGVTGAVTLGRGSARQWAASISFLRRYSGLKGSAPASAFYTNQFISK